MYFTSLKSPQLFPAVGWVQQAVPQMISKVAVKLENTCNQLRKKLGQSVETEIDGLNSLLTQQDQVCFFSFFIISSNS